MISRTTGEIDFSSGLHIRPHCSLESLAAGPVSSVNIKTHKLLLQDWKRHILGSHRSEHGKFEVEALSFENSGIQIVLMAHQHAFYEKGTPEDSERRVFHEGVISTDLGGQREFPWGEVICRLEAAANKDWLVVAYSRDAKVPSKVKEVLLHLRALEKPPE